MKTPKFRATNTSCFLQTKIAAVVAICVLAGCSTTGGGIDELLGEEPLSNIELSEEDAIDYDGAGFSRKFYGAIGAGASRLEPDTSAAQGISVDENTVPAGQITVGADLSNTFSVELHSADLGSAGLSPAGRINYHVNGGSVLMYAGKDRSDRKGLMGFGRVGVALTDNSAVGDVNFESNEDPQPLVGAGLEYYVGRNFGLRSEVIVFDKDAQFAQLGVIYRLGGGSSGTDELPDTITPVALPTPEPQALPEFTDLPELTELPELPELPELASTPEVADIGLDTDADGIPDSFDTCPATDVGMEVDDNGCAIFNGVVDGVNFARGSAQLTDEAVGILDNVIRTLREHPDALIAIAAHTDGRGREEDNLTLSRDRAVSVARYLITRGIPKSQMSARAFGEYQPIAENDTAEGRAMNRRVEIVASKSKPAN